MNLADLNARFGLPNLRFVEGPGGLMFAEIDNRDASATVCLQGAHITTYRPKHQAEPVIWLSEQARFAHGKSIRGGVPVCWPWFGAHATASDFPGHGFARTVMWQVVGSATPANGETALTLALIDTDQTRAQWPHPSRVQLKATFGRQLHVELTTTNMGETAFTLGEALHTYLHIGDIADIRITGLEGCEYLDKVEGGARKTQHGALVCSGEVDRVYVNTTATCVVEDARLGRRLTVAKTGSSSTVVWTPWAEKADRMGDFGPHGWRGMVCVESGNALENVVQVAAGASHTLAVTYRAETI